MNDYLKLLLKQFKKANGLSTIDMNSSDFVQEFLGWIKERNISGNKYLELLNCMGISQVNDKLTCEIGKGKYDSIVKSLKTTIITPYTEGLEKLGPDRVVKAEFYVYGATPIMGNISEDGTKQIYKNVNSKLTFMTQNPYSVYNIFGWDEMYNSGVNDIIVGVFGNTYDKDRKSKIRQLEDFRSRLFERVIEEKTTIDDTYCYTIVGNMKVKKRYRNYR